MLFAEGDTFVVRVRACGAWKEDEGFVAEVGGGDGFMLSQCVVRREHGDKGLREEDLCLEAVRWAAVAEEARVEGPFGEGLHDSGGVGLVELKVDFGELFAVPAEHVGQRSQHAGADEANAQKACFAAAYAAGFIEVFLHVLQGAAGAVEECLAGAGELDGSRGAGEEAVAEDVFELADLLREGRLGKVEAACSSPEMKLFGNGDEVSEVAKLDVSIHM